jgi:hypothetical protein
MNMVYYPIKNMKTNNYIAACLVAFLINLATYISSGQSTNNLTPPPGFVTRLDYLKSFTNENDIVKAYKQSIITKNEAIMAHFLVGNLKQQDFYGEVIDQNGQPVVKADVAGYLRSDEGFDTSDEKVEVLKTKTDAKGFFQFTGIHGARFGQKVSKEGYQMGQGSGFYVRPNDQDKTSPTERAVFKMWKLLGAEPMVHTQLHAGLACDGTPKSFNLLTGQKLSAGGDLIVTLVRNPVDINRLKHFDWTLTLSIPLGGLAEFEGGYENEAPLTNYQTTIKIAMPANTKNWAPYIRRKLMLTSIRPGHEIWKLIAKKLKLCINRAR